MDTSKRKNKTTKGLGTRFKEARKKLGLTQVEVANKSKMTVNYYAMIERGEVNPSLEKLQSITSALGLKLELS